MKEERSLIDSSRRILNACVRSCVGQEVLPLKVLDSKVATSASAIGYRGHFASPYVAKQKHQTQNTPPR